MRIVHTLQINAGADTLFERKIQSERELNKEKRKSERRDIYSQIFSAAVSSHQAFRLSLNHN